jgi:hypothetical protein
MWAGLRLRVGSVAPNHAWNGKRDHNQAGSHGLPQCAGGFSAPQPLNTGRPRGWPKSPYPRGCGRLDGRGYPPYLPNRGVCLRTYLTGGRGGSPYTATMPTVEGPCQECGAPVKRYVRPGRQCLCHPCAIDRAAEYNRALADGTNPDLERSREAGRRVGAEIARKEGKSYERWRDGMRAAAERM